jgi:hypothetical protein
LKHIDGSRKVVRFKLLVMATIPSIDLFQWGIEEPDPEKIEAAIDVGAELN